MPTDLVVATACIREIPANSNGSGYGQRDPENEPRRLVWFDYQSWVIDNSTVAALRTIPKKTAMDIHLRGDESHSQTKTKDSLFVGASLLVTIAMEFPGGRRIQYSPVV